MHAKQQLKQFRRIHKHYEMELDALTAELKKLNQRMSKRRREFEQLEAEMKNAQRPHRKSVSIVDCEASAARLKLVSRNWDSKFQEYSQASAEFEEQRSRVQQQLSRIESMNRLIEQKSRMVKIEDLKRDQLAADERYLQHAGGGVFSGQSAMVPEARQQ